MPPIAPARAPPSRAAPPAIARQAPQRPPVTMRAQSPTGAVRAGVLGSWSATNSTSAKTVKIPRLHFDPMNAKGELWRLIQPRWEAQATTAGAVSERSPATIPMPKASNRANVEVIELLPYAENLIPETWPVVP